MTDLDRRTFLGAAAAGIAVAKAGPTHAETASMTDATTKTHAVDMPAFVDHSHLTVVDLPTTSAFYQKVMGLTVLDTGLRRDTRRCRPAAPDADDGQQCRPRAAQCARSVPHRLPRAQP